MKKRRTTVELLGALRLRLAVRLYPFPLFKTRNEVYDSARNAAGPASPLNHNPPLICGEGKLSSECRSVVRLDSIQAQLHASPQSDGAFWATSIRTEVLCLVLTVVIGHTGRRISIVFVSSRFSDIDTVCLTAQQCQSIANRRIPNDGVGWKGRMGPGKPAPGASHGAFPSFFVCVRDGDLSA